MLSSNPLNIKSDLERQELYVQLERKHVYQEVTKVQGGILII